MEKTKEIKKSTKEQEEAEGSFRAHRIQRKHKHGRPHRRFLILGRPPRSARGVFCVQNLQRRLRRLGDPLSVIGIGLILFAQRMYAIKPDRKYADIAELALYNGFLCGLSLDGKSFFYDNSIEVDLIGINNPHDNRHRPFP